MSNAPNLNLKILELADHCVKCGLCSSQCPTYRIKQDENESPRGRIALAQALASNAIPAGDKISSHFDNCLQCRQCEVSCPSEVKYGELIKLSQELLFQKKTKKQRLKVFIINTISTLSDKNWQKIEILRVILKYTQLLQLLRLSKTGRLLHQTLSNTSSKKSRHGTTTPLLKKERVFLFTGCLSHILDQQSLQACIGLLEHCGYSVNTPGNQACCGAIASRHGLSEIEQQCQINNQSAFTDPNNNPVIFFTTGCGSKLKEYKNQLPSNIEFSARTISITDFLINSPLFAQLKFSTLKKKVLVFNPCSEKNALRQTGISEKLLARIPGIEIVSLPSNTGCCGASGSHFITHKQQAEQIRQPILEQITLLSPDFIVSPNYPCNLHIHAGLKEKNLDIPMIHPIELLFNQIKYSRAI